jgi:hypothetical protein
MGWMVWFQINFVLCMVWFGLVWFWGGSQTIGCLICNFYQNRLWLQFSYVNINMQLPAGSRHYSLTFC